MRYTAIVVVVAALLAGCAGARVRSDVHEDGWLLVETEHIALRTDLEQWEAMWRARELEQYWQALGRLYGLFKPGATVPRGPFQVIHMKSCEELQRLSGRYAFAFAPGSWTSELVAVTCAGHDDQTVLHELAHVFNHHYFPGSPVWVDEGLATYYSTLQVRNGRATLGILPPEVRSRWRGRSESRTSLEAIRRMDAARFHRTEDRDDHYFAAWKLVHLLSSTEPDLQLRFRRYLAAIAGAASNDDAWAQAFGDRPAEPLARVFEVYQRRKRVNVWTAKYEWADPPRPRVRPLRAGEAHILWANLLTSRDGPAGMAEQLELAAEADPSWPELPYWRAVLVRGSDALELLRGYVSRFPDDARGWNALVEIGLERTVPPTDLGLDGPPPAGLAAMARDVRRLVEHASDPHALNTIGRYYAMKREPATGLNFAIRAVRAEPDCSDCWDTVALLYFQAGKVADALKAQERAIGLSGERATPAILSRLRRYRMAARGTSAK